MLENLFGDPNKRHLNKIQPMVEEINKLESQFGHFSNEELKNKTNEFKKRIKEGVSLDDILPEAFAAIREASKRTLNQRHFDAQIVGGIVLHQGKIAEMKTGEGKTLAATLPLYLNALTGNGVQLVTVNDYLARRDAVWMGQIYYALGLSTSCIAHDAAYIYDPEYIQKIQNLNIKNQNDNSKLKIEKLDEKRDEVGGFKVIEDFLRPVSRREAYQADVLYGTNNEFGFDYLRDNMAHTKEDICQRDFNFAIVDEVDSILIDEARTPLIISAPDVESAKLYQQFAKIVPQLKREEDFQIDEKMRAVTLTNAGMDKMEKILGIGNIYEEKGIQIVHHLEQALRAEILFKKDKDYIIKDGEVIIVDEFTGRMMPGRRYSGGLHQAIEAKERVEVQKESKTLATITFQNYFRMYKKLAGMTGTALTNAEEFDKVYKLEAIVIPTNKPMVRKDLADMVYKNESGKFKALVQRVKECHEKGQPVLIGTISIEKNEHLGNLLKREGIVCNILNAKNHEKEGEIIAQTGKSGSVTVATNMAGRGVDIVLGGNPQNSDDAQKVKELGGLFVIGTERHEARRIDDQLRGRSGRQGDSGASQFFVSLEDELMQRFGSDRIKNLMDAFKIPDDQPIQNKLISNAIEKAQAKIEGYNFDIRNHVLEYDEVMNKQRTAIYKMRREVLFATDEEMENKIKELMDEEEYKKYQEKTKDIVKNDIRNIEKFVILRTVDTIWMEHLDTMECLRDSVKLRAYGQRDPLVEYKNEGGRLFREVLQEIDNGIVDVLLNAEFKEQPANQQRFSRPMQANSKKGEIGRNDSCSCGSGKKYKKCCGK
jgi:preprotein translocase subunit SecA